MKSSTQYTACSKSVLADLMRIADLYDDSLIAMLILLVEVRRGNTTLLDENGLVREAFLSEQFALYDQRQRTQTRASTTILEVALEEDGRFLEEEEGTDGSVLSDYYRGVPEDHVEQLKWFERLFYGERDGGEVDILLAFEPVEFDLMALQLAHSQKDN